MLCLYQRKPATGPSCGSSLHSSPCSGGRHVGSICTGGFLFELSGPTYANSYPLRAPRVFNTTLQSSHAQSGSSKARVEPRPLIERKNNARKRHAYVLLPRHSLSSESLGTRFIVQYVSSSIVSHIRASYVYRPRVSKGTGTTYYANHWRS